MDDDVALLPIDIHVGKLVDWLVSRQHATKDWPQITRVIRENINEAIQDMPEHPEITRLLSGSYINYFHCLKIVEILRETEADSKNILGWYTSQRMKDWQSVVKLYEKAGTSLAESGQLLHRYIIHEIPGIKSQITRCKQIQQECDKKEADIYKAAANASNLYQKQVKQIGIEGEDVRSELLSLVEGLPADLHRIAHLFHHMKDGMQFYLNFIAFTCHARFSDSLPMLRYIIEHGNVTTYEFTHKKIPKSIEDPFAAIKKMNLQTKCKKEAENTDTIDFGDTDCIDFGNTDQSAEIDFGIEVDNANGIDFGIEVEDGDGGIDFGEDEDAVAVDNSDVGQEAGVAKGTMALTLLHNASTRARILDDVYELEGFLNQRLLETGAMDESRMALNLFDEAPKSLQMVSAAQMGCMLVAVTAVLAEVTTPKMLQLLLISDSHKYVERLSDSLDQQHRRGLVAPAALEAIHTRRQLNAQKEQSLADQLVKVQAAAVTLGKQLQEAISVKYKGRTVNIMGVMQKK